MSEFRDKTFDWNTVLQRNADRSSQRVHKTADCGSFFGHSDEQLSGSSIFIEANDEISLVTTHIKFVRD